MFKFRTVFLYRFWMGWPTNNEWDLHTVRRVCVCAGHTRSCVQYFHPNNTLEDTLGHRLAGLNLFSQICVLQKSVVSKCFKVPNLQIQSVLPCTARLALAQCFPRQDRRVVKSGATAVKPSPHSFCLCLHPHPFHGLGPLLSQLPPPLLRRLSCPHGARLLSTTSQQNPTVSPTVSS